LLGIVVVLKGLAEFAGLLLVGQGLVYALSFGRHEANAVYRMFRLSTSPLIWFAKKISPKQVADKHLPFVSLAIVFWVLFITMDFLYPDWIVLVIAFFRGLGA
jgi:hypothetical protein